MIIDCIADLHGFYPQLEGGDLLIVAGDLTARDTQLEMDKFDDWLSHQPYKKKIFIAGNHDNLLKKEKPQKYFMGNEIIKFEKFEYLCDSGTEFEGLKIWGSPYAPWFKGVHPKCKAFMKNDGSLSKHFNKIPLGTDILITHGPAFGILDGIPLEDGTLYHVGSKSLYGWLEYVERPLIHVFGHIHEGYGQEEYFPSYNDRMMISVNCSYVNEHYKPVNKPIRVIL